MRTINTCSLDLIANGGGLSSEDFSLCHEIYSKSLQLLNRINWNAKQSAILIQLAENTVGVVWVQNISRNLVATRLSNKNQRSAIVAFI